MYGVLNSQQKDHAYFYMRDPVSPEGLSKAEYEVQLLSAKQTVVLMMFSGLHCNLTYTQIEYKTCIRSHLALVKEYVSCIIQNHSS